MPHISDKPFKRKASLGNDYRYYPLLRGITDVPSKGDPVLLATIGKVRYYLGPINTSANNPTWNDDPSFRAEPELGNFFEELTERGVRGESPNFNKENLYSRLVKTFKPEFINMSVLFFPFILKSIFCCTKTPLEIDISS